MDFRNWVDSGLSFNNVFDVPRNLGNRADKVEMQAIDYFRSRPDEKERLAPFKDEEGEPFYHFSQPIWMEQHCLKCHGRRERAPKGIQQRYTKAYGYKVGDLRGLMSIKLPAAIIEKRVSAQLWNNALSHFGGLVVTFIVLSWLLQTMVLSRISVLKDAAVRMAGGDYSKPAELPGNDEVTQVLVAFGDMSQRIAQRERALEIQKSLYAALSKTSRSITRLDSQNELFADACRIAVEHGGMGLAYIGLLDDNEQNLVVVESAGGDLQGVRYPMLQSSPQEAAPAVTVICEDHPNYH